MSAAIAERLLDRPLWWHLLDFSGHILFPLAGFSLMIFYIVTGQYTAFDVALCVSFYLATGIGITVGWHRLFSHKAFKSKQWLRLTLAVLGAFAWQRPLFVWVMRHRLHHAHPDKKGDFHSPYVRYDGTKISGTFNQVFHAYYLWLHWYDPIMNPHSPLIKDLYEDRELRWINSHHCWLALASIVLPGFMSATFYGTMDGFIRGVAWGGLGRIFIFLQTTWLINSVTHYVGKRPYCTRDGSTNSSILGWLVVGEGYHNNHHAFPSSPCLGFDKGQFDIGWLFIKLMRNWGQIYALKAIPDARRRAFRQSSRRAVRAQEYQYGINR